MKKLLIISILIFSITILHAQEGRFTHRIFNNINTTTAIPFSQAARIGDTALTSLYLDFYEPANDEMAHRPLVITVFGGAFVIGSRTEIDMVAYADSLSHYGYAVASIDYRLVPILQITQANMIRGGYMAAQDVNAAIRFFKANSELYRIDTNQIFLLGNSAGSIASLYELYLDDSQRPAETYTEPDLGSLNSTGFDYYSHNSSSIAGIISHWGGVTDLSMIDADENTPVCFIHGTADVTVPYDSGYCSLMPSISPMLYGSHQISLRLDNFGIEHELHPFDGELHAFYYTATYNLDISKFDSCFHITRDFLARHNNYVTNIQNYTNCLTPFSIYPNPTSDYLYFHSSNNTFPGQIITITLFNSFGKNIKTLNINNLNNKINIQDLPAGLYIRAIRTNGTVYYSKIVKR